MGERNYLAQLAKQDKKGENNGGWIKWRQKRMIWREKRKNRGGGRKRETAFLKSMFIKIRCSFP